MDNDYYCMLPIRGYVGFKINMFSLIIEQQHYAVGIFFFCSSL